LVLPDVSKKLLIAQGRLGRYVGKSVDVDQGCIYEKSREVLLPPKPRELDKTCLI
jgi:hypothetical protein